MTFRTLTLTFLSLSALACGGKSATIGSSLPAPDAGTVPPDGGTPPADAAPTTDGGGCTSNADCTGSTQCVFAVDTACTAHGVCLLANDEPCGAESRMTACGCNGSEVDWVTGCVGVPTGYAPEPVAHLGACSDAGPACTTDADCGDLYLVCAFPVNGGCSAQGQCVAPGPACDPATPIACACDGTAVPYGQCSGFPDGFAGTPIAHTGPCP